jgi:hypothetical protein
MTEIDPVSSALGRIESKCDNLLEQNKILFEKVDDINSNGCSAFRQEHSSNNRSAAIFGTGAGAAIAGIAEMIRTYLNK